MEIGTGGEGEKGAPATIDGRENNKLGLAGYRVFINQLQSICPTLLHENLCSVTRSTFSRLKVTLEKSFCRFFYDAKNVRYFAIVKNVAKLLFTKDSVSINGSIYFSYFL